MKNILFAALMLLIVTFTESCRDDCVCNGDDQPNSGNECEFGTISDFDGNGYKTVKIFDREWMAENLNVSHFRNGDTIYHAYSKAMWEHADTSQIGAWCYYENNTGYGEIYGKLYNWFAINDSRGLAPDGWHVPSDEEWETLVDDLGKDAGGKLKATGTHEDGNGYFFAPNNGATDTVCLSALPGGWRSIWIFKNRGILGCYWSSTEYYEESQALYRELSAWDTDIDRKFDDKGFGYSVRCMKD